MIPRLIAASIAATTAVVSASQQKPTFRSRLDVVAVDVAVTNGNTPVAGLNAQDFALLDNGVPQQVELLSIGKLPIDVTLVVDTSGSVVNLLDRIRESIRRVASILRPDDRLRVLTFASTTTQVLELGERIESLAIDALRARGSTSLNDALVQALVRGAEPARRHLIAAFTDGWDNSSVSVPEHVLEVARRTDSFFVVALWPTPVRPAPYPNNTSQLALLSKATDATGGQLYEGSSPDAIDRTFRRIFDAYRQSYLLRYEPTGVTRTGWHEITVKVVKAGGGKYTIRARKGFQGE